MDADGERRVSVGEPQGAADCPPRHHGRGGQCSGTLSSLSVLPVVCMHAGRNGAMQAAMGPGSFYFILLKLLQV